MEKVKEIEKSIIKTYRQDIWRPFVKGVSDYQLIQPNDRIMVCISGGKDSFILAKCLQELQRHWIIPFETRFVCMNPGYNPEVMRLIEENARLLDIPLEVFETRIFDVVDLESSHGSPCYLCARMRRGALYAQAQKLGCNKIALGHHFSDVIETSLMSMLYSAEIKTMMPKLHSDNYPGIDLIRPLYLVHEDAIINWKNHFELQFIHCSCPMADREHYNNDGSGKRQEIKEMIRELKKTNPLIEQNIFNSMHNVNLSCVLGYHKDGPKVSFLDDYINPTLEEDRKESE